MKTAKKTFKPRAELLLQLGDQLIKNENIAIIELIKNAYDADASYAKLSLYDLTSPLLGTIILEDNGTGMSLDIIENIWLEPGNTHKRDFIQSDKKTPKGRLPIGEKGIGRFGVHKLGHKISLITKAKNCKEVIVDIDWDKFLNAKYLEDIEIDIVEREPEVFLNGATGTKIIISKLNIEWTKKNYFDLKRAVEHFNSPFETKTDFKVEFISNMGNWDDESLQFKDIKQYALYHYISEIDEKGYESFCYEFLPYDNMEVKGRTVERSYLITDSDGNKITKQNINIGTIKFELYAFDRDNNIIKKYLTADKKQFKDYLDLNGGISVFRDGLRVYDYGEPENDWLGLDLARVNQPTSKLSNNLVIGAVLLTRKESTSLIEKANREGFVENEAYKIFKQIILSSLSNFLTYRNADKSRLKNYRKISKEPVLDDVKYLKQKIDLSELSQPDKKEMLVCLDRISRDYEQIREINLMTSSAGLSYGIVIHEIEKVIKELKLKVVSEQISLDFKKSVSRLADLIQSYSDLIRRKSKSDNSLIDILKQSIFNCEYRLQAHNIDIDYSLENNRNIKCSYNLIVGAILNIFDNSIWWLHKYQIDDKKIYCQISDYKEGYISLVIADNGLGFTISPEDAVKPFVTQKNGGIGLGLNITNEIMISHGGVLDFPEYESLKGFPKEFRNGAIVALCFKE